MIRRLLGRVGVVLAGSGLAACATGGAAISPGEDLARSAPLPPDPQGEAYYHFSVAQMAAQGGRFHDAIPAVREAIKRDPTSSFLWTTLAQWLVRTEQYHEALAAARRAIEPSPGQAAPHPTPAGLLPAPDEDDEAEAGDQDGIR